MNDHDWIEAIIVYFKYTIVIGFNVCDVTPL